MEKYKHYVVTWTYLARLDHEPLTLVLPGPENSTIFMLACLAVFHALEGALIWGTWVFGHAGSFNVNECRHGCPSDGLQSRTGLCVGNGVGTTVPHLPGSHKVMLFTAWTVTLQQSLGLSIPRSHLKSRGAVPGSTLPWVQLPLPLLMDVICLWAHCTFLGQGRGREWARVLSGDRRRGKCPCDICHGVDHPEKTLPIAV